MLFFSFYFFVRVNVFSRFFGDCEVLFFSGILVFRIVVVQRFCRYFQWRKCGFCCVCLFCIMLCCLFFFFVGIVFIIILIVLVYERYIRVVYVRVINFFWVWRVFIYIWLYFLVWLGVFFLGWNRYILDIYGLGCVVDWKFKDVNDFIFVFFLFFGCLVVFMGVIVYCYGYILYFIRMVS